MNSLILGRRLTISYTMALLLLIGLTVAVEAAFAVPLKMPGHRAFPGGFMLLVAAEGLAPMMLLALAAIVPVALFALGLAEAWTIGVYLIPAVLLVWLYPKPLIKGIPGFVVLGLVFGLLRYLSLSFGAHHHAPELIRLGGHLGFGAAAGLSAYATVKFTTNKE